MIASTMVRASAQGLPLRPVGRGSMSAIIDHWASESTWNLDIWPVSQDGRYIFVRHALGPRGAGRDADSVRTPASPGKGVLLMSAFKNLLSPLQIGGLRLPNRVIMAPMGTELITQDGRSTPREASYYAARPAGRPA